MPNILNERLTTLPYSITRKLINFNNRNFHMEILIIRLHLYTPKHENLVEGFLSLLFKIILQH